MPNDPADAPRRVDWQSLNESPRWYVPESLPFKDWVALPDEPTTCWMCRRRAPLRGVMRGLLSQQWVWHRFCHPCLELADLLG